MKKIIFSILFLTISVQAQVLGELKGTGQLSVKTIKTDQTSSYDSTCKIAMNIHQNESSLEYEFSVFECSGLDFWNDSPWKVQIIGSDLFLPADGNTPAKKVGQIEPDNSFTVEFSNIIAKTVQDYVPMSYECKPTDGHFVEKKFSLLNKIKFNFKKLENGSYAIKRESHSEQISSEPKKKWGNCLYWETNKYTNLTTTTGTVAP